MGRLLLVSNRLPITVRAADGQVTVEKSAGGLATGLSRPHERGEGLWLGWPGDVTALTGDQRAQLEARFRQLRVVPLYLTSEEVSRYYEGFSNGVVWPLFHYMLDKLPLEGADFEAYRAANQRFADLAAEHYREGDLVWVHDYQLALVPGMLREKLPNARIGFFLHIPFPAAEVFRTLPWRSQLLQGLLGADLIGFHTLSYVRAFANSLLQVLGVPAEVDRIQYQGRAIRIGAFPMGIDVETFAAEAESSDVLEEIHRLKSGGQRLLLGVDRLDYTKGIPTRLLAFERFLERNPDARGKVRLLQVAVPSRTEVEAYAALRAQVNALVGRINGKFGTLSQVPLHYIYRSISARQLIGLYRAADVMLVTPVRDGMNLVAKEFVAARNDEDGVLILSELAGAASELGEALQVNPYDAEQIALELERALAMPRDERRIRMAAMRESVQQHDVHHWAQNFVDELERLPQQPPNVGIGLTPAAELDALVGRLRSAGPRVLLLDYDGTLRGFASHHELAAPDPELLELLLALANDPANRVHLVSGRRRDTLERWFGAAPVSLHAEHGLWTRLPGSDWRALANFDTSWKEPLRRVMAQFMERAPGSFIEEKTATLVWHYRMADPEFGELQANELHLHINQRFSNVPVEVIQGDKVLEVRPYGVNKGVILETLTAEERAGTLLAIGDDRTDEDLFRALPEGALSIHVGPRPSVARYRLRDVEATRGLLRSLLDESLRPGAHERA